MTGFLLLRVRGHRLLLTAALIAVLLTTAVLATLAAFAGSVGDAGLSHALRTKDAKAASLTITSEHPGPDRDAAERGARRGAQQAFDGLPVTLRQLDRSGPYALPRTLQPPADRKGEPDLTMFAVVDPSRVRLSAGGWPTAGAGEVTEVAVPEAVATQLRLSPGPRVLTLTDRLRGPAVRIRVTGVYRPADRNDPYWRLDELDGRGVRKDAFTTYGPLLIHAADFGSGHVSRGSLSWVAAADFRTLGADRIESLRAAAKNGQKFLAAQPALKGDVVTRTSLPEVLDQLERALLVSRATLLIVSLQLALLAAYALLLVARLLSTERAGETQVLLARGASRGRLASLAAQEALLLALPAAVCAPLLAGPLTRLLVGHGLPARIGLHIETGPTTQAWLIGLAVALACAVAVAAPALTVAGAATGSRSRTLPAPLRAGADVGLLVVAAVAYWQLDRRTSGSGALSQDRTGELGIDPLLVVAPALALLAGTVVTLRLLPPTARLAERRAARSRGLVASFAGWQLSRRPLRGAGPVLLLVLAVALGMLAIGQGATWDRSQDDQADFRSGAPIRVLGSGAFDQLGQDGANDSMPGLRTAVPAARTDIGLSGGRQATVLALDTGLAAQGLQLRDDLAGGDPEGRVAALRPAKKADGGVPLHSGTTRLLLDYTLRAAEAGPHSDPNTIATVTVEDRHGVPYRLQPGTLRADGRPHTATVDVTDAAVGRPAGPLLLTAIEVAHGGYPDRKAPRRLTVDRMRTVTADGTTRAVSAPADLAWQANATVDRDPFKGEAAPAITSVHASAGTRLDVSYHTGTAAYDDWGAVRTVTVRATVDRAEPAVPRALATDRFLESSGASTGSVIEVPMPGGPVKVTITGVLGGIPTTGADARGPAAAGVTGVTATDGGALLLDLRAVNQVLAARPDSALPPTEWWLFTEPGGSPARIAAALRDRAELDPGQILVRDETAAQLHDDPLGAGPRAALLAAAVAAAALAAVGFAVGTVGALRERSAEFAVLRALGAPRRRLVRLLAVEQSLLIGIALVIGVALGTVLTRAVVPLIVLTGQATQPVPSVLVELPVGRVALLLAAVAAGPVLVVVALALRRGDPAAALRVQGGE